MQLMGIKQIFIVLSTSCAQSSTNNRIMGLVSTELTETT